MEMFVSFFKSSTCVNSPYVVHALKTSCGKDVSQFILGRLKMKPRNLTIGFDGVSALGKHATLYTFSKGSMSLFLTISHLGNESHDTEDETTATVNVIKDIRTKLGIPVSNAAVENAAHGFATQALLLYSHVFTSNPQPVTTRDPADCSDLIANDLGKLQCLKPFLMSLGNVIKLLKNPYIFGECKKTKKQNKIDKFVKGQENQNPEHS